MFQRRLTIWTSRLAHGVAWIVLAGLNVLAWAEVVVIIAPRPIVERLQPVAFAAAAACSACLAGSIWMASRGHHRAAWVATAAGMTLPFIAPWYAGVMPG